MITVFFGILMFMFLVLIHELGHFLFSKFFGVQVKEFGIGIPPKLFTFYKDKSGTEYSINLLPLGGFVRLKGEEITSETEIEDQDSFLAKKLRQKSLILIGGISMNFIFAWILFTLAFWGGIKPIGILPDFLINYNCESYLMPSVLFASNNNLLSGGIGSTKSKIAFVLTGSTAEKIGLKENDTIISFNNTQINGFNFEPNFLKKNNLCGQDFSMQVGRDNKIITLNGKIDSSDCKLGIAPMPDIDSIKLNKIQTNIFQAFGYAGQEIFAETKLTLYLLKDLGGKLFSFEKEQINEIKYNLSGPVGAVKVGQYIYEKQGFFGYLAFAGMISLALAIFNILPIPAIDGGRLFGIILQTGLKLNKKIYFKYENYINIVFFIGLLGLGIYVILLDLTRFWGVSIPGINF